MRRVLTACGVAVAVVVMVACSPTRHVPDGSYLLDHVKIETSDKGVKPSDLKSYLRQEPNHRMFGLFRFSLGLYNLSGNDSTKWFSRPILPRAASVWTWSTGCRPTSRTTSTM